MSKISLPCLRARMGDWFYYVALLSFKEVAERVKLPEEIDEKYSDPNLQLGDWIQRKITKKRLRHIIDYLKKQEQHFFNTLILGLYDGNPTWQELNISTENEFEEEEKLDYLGRTFGILTLDGKESIFAIDGQHRANAIRIAVKEKHELNEDEIAVIFLAHKTTEIGKERTRRLFSTLNKYAKPVSESEIIALSEDNNASIITRSLIDDNGFLKDKILVHKNRSINNENSTQFTTIPILYDIVIRINTNKSVYGIKVSGKDNKSYLTDRQDDQDLKQDERKVIDSFKQLISNVPSIDSYFNQSQKINRKAQDTSLLFKPIGQSIFFDVYKVASEYDKRKKALEYFSKDDFNLHNKIWHKILWNVETGNIKTDKPFRRFSTKLILEHIGIDVKKTPKDIEVSKQYNIKL